MLLRELNNKTNINTKPGFSSLKESGDGYTEEKTDNSERTKGSVSRRVSLKVVSAGGFQSTALFLDIASASLLVKVQVLERSRKYVFSIFVSEEFKERRHLEK